MKRENLGGLLKGSAGIFIFFASIILCAGSSNVGAATTYTLTIQNDGHGSTTPSSSAAPTKSVAYNIIATPKNAGWTFLNWKVVSGSSVTFGNANAASTTVTLASGNATIMANFTANYVFPSACTATNMNMKVDGQIKCYSLNIHDWQLVQKGKSALPPDYVFSKDYDLKSLEDVGQYIKEKGHLPEMPSANEMKSEGVDMVQMNFSLLKKIEEMTLRMIEEEKEIAELRSTLERLEGKGKKASD
jgi:hypothetical protein